MFNRFLFSALILLTSISLYAQPIKEFSEDKATFLEELDQFMNTYKNEEVENVHEEIEKAIKSGYFNDDEYAQINKTSRSMLEQRMAVKPYFLLYYKTVLAVKKVERGGGKFLEFHKVADAMIADIENRNTNAYKEYLDFIFPFYSENALRKSGSNYWIFDAPIYELTYEDKKLRISFDKVDLVGFRKQDSIAIQMTSGVFLPTEDTWQGEGGKVKWDRTGLKNVYADLATYELELKKNQYICKDATLYYPKLFPNKGIKGTLEDRIIVQSETSTPTYPRFQSNESILPIDNIGAGIKYIGGFKLNGTTVYGYGTKERPAAISIFHTKTNSLLIKARSEQFVIRQEELIVSEGTQTTMYFGKDSITHPSTNLRFEIPEKSLTLKRGDRGSDRNPFYNSFHKVQLDADQLNWVLETDSIVLGEKTLGIGGGKDKVVTFESWNYFNEGDYNRIQSIADYNPIALLKVMTEMRNSNKLQAIDVAQKINKKFDVSSIKSLIYQLIKEGFIKYDEETEEIEVLEKTLHYADAARKKVDYDHIRIESNTKETNAIIRLDDESPIDINDVKFIEFSPIKKVGVKPFGKQVQLRENRNMRFDGEIFGGMTAFTGKDFEFEYSPFHISMDSIRYFDLFEATGNKDNDGNPEAYTIGSRIEHAKGVLLIDAPNNKSGKEEIDMFPSFTSTGYSYVFYDSPETQEGTYKRDSFYFRLDKFGMTNLGFYMPSDISFKGKMFSFDIFPPFDETLVLNKEDKSLGFVHALPSAGYDTYQKKGNYTGQVSLSNEGFLGIGNINYLNASIDSEDIVFRPKRMTCSARTFNLEESRGGFQSPQVQGIDVSINWRPYRDSMYVNSEEAPFNLFKAGLHSLEGQIILTPGGVRGNGLLDWDKASMTSEDFLFNPFGVDADTANLSIKTVGVEGQLAFDTKNVNAKLDFDKNIGKFKSNTEELTTRMPYNQYMTSMGEFDWDMEKGTIQFIATKGKDAEFLSIHPDQDSLIFKGTTAFYDLNASLLSISGVEFINSADAIIYPETGEIEIGRDADMTTLENAKIVASRENKNHVINRATVKILGRKDFKGSGFYEYNVGNKEQEIEFQEIVGARIGKGKRAEKETATRGKGTVIADDNFYIDHKTKFQGDISLSSETKNLEFKGYAYLDEDILPIKRWFTIHSEGDKNDLAITFENPKTLEGEPTKTGLYISQYGDFVYPSVLAPTTSRKDRALLDIKGVFKYDKKQDIFILGDSLKVVTNATRGNKMIINARDGKTTASGRFNLGEGLDFITLDGVGIAESNVQALRPEGDTLQVNPKMRELEVDMLAGIAYILPEKMLKAMTNDIIASSYGLQAISIGNNKPHIIDGIAELIPNEKEYKAALAAYQSYSRVDLPKNLQERYTFFFSKLPMKWHDEYQSLVTTQKMNGLAYIGGQAIHRTLEVYAEFRMPDNMEDGCHIYIKIPSDTGHYYYFNYKNGVLKTVSSNPEYNAALLGMKSKETKIKMGKDEYYEIQPINEGSADFFVRRVSAAW